MTSSQRFGLAFFLSIFALGCGARSELDVGAEPDAGSSDDADSGAERDAGPSEDADSGCELPNQVAGVVMFLLEDICILQGSDLGGVEHEVTCGGLGDNFRGCIWRTEGEFACECNNPDFANTCGNGVPTCADWRGRLDASGF